MSANLTDKKLERAGLRLFKRMELNAVGGLAQAPLKQLNPSGAYGKSDHLEVDYLIPVAKTCLVGEITSRNAAHAEKKYGTFRKHFTALDVAYEKCKSHQEKDTFWKTLGVKGADVIKFRDVTELKPFAVFTNVERYQLDQNVTVSIPIIFKYDWRTLCEYAETIGTFARFPFLDMFGLVNDSNEFPEEQLIIKEKSLLKALHKYVTSHRKHRCHVLTFVVDPYKLLPLSRVYRRDCLPDPLSAGQKYQRCLVPKKLHAMRKDLLRDQDFAFPNTLLVVLAKGCSFDQQQHTLTIPKRYGAVNIVDGQHRLFAYADHAVQNRMGDQCQVLVTALYFEGASTQEIGQFSARTFIEINTNQTKVSTLHLEGIAYQILGRKDPRSLAAHVLRTINERPNKIRGVFRTSDAPTGIIKITEVVGALARITNLERITSLRTPKSLQDKTLAVGYKRLLGAHPKALSTPTKLLSKLTPCLERYFGILEKVFRHDFPRAGNSNNLSSFGLTKMIAAFVLLLNQFISEGLDWASVEGELSEILVNVLKLRSKTSYSVMLFEIGIAELPSSRHRISDDFKFLNANRTEPTAISAIVDVS